MPKIVILHWNKNTPQQEEPTCRERLREKWENLLRQTSKEPEKEQ